MVPFVWSPFVLIVCLYDDLSSEVQFRSSQMGHLFNIVSGLSSSYRVSVFRPNVASALGVPKVWTD